MRLNERAGGLAAAAVSTLAYVLGAILHTLLPWGAPALVSFVFRVDIVELAQPFSWMSFGAGLVLFAGFGALFGFAGCWTYNRLCAQYVHDLALKKEPAKAS